MVDGAGDPVVGLYACEETGDPADGYKSFRSEAECAETNQVVALEWLDRIFPKT